MALIYDGRGRSKWKDWRYPNNPARGNPGSREPSQEPLTGQPDIVEKGPAGGGPPEGQDVNPLPSEGLEPAGVLRWLGMQLQAEQETPGTEQKDNLPCLRASLLPTRSLHRGMRSRFSINKVNPSPVALTPPALSWVAELGGVLGCPPSPPAPRACSPTRSPFQLRSERVTLQCRLHLGKATCSPFHCHICAATAEMAFGWEISSGYAEGRGRGEVGACLIGSQQSGQLFSGV